MELENKILEEFKSYNIISHSYPNAIGMWLYEIEDLIWACVSANPDGDFLEIGSFHGGTAVLMCLCKKYTNENGHVFSLDRKFDPMFDRNIKFGGLEKWSVKNQGDSIDFNKIYTGGKLSCALIDGWHSFKAVLLDFENVNQHLMSNGFVMFHDVDIFESEKEIDDYYKEAVNNYDYYMSEPLPNPNVDEQSFRLEQAVAYIIRKHGFKIVVPPKSTRIKRSPNEWKPGQHPNNSLTILRKP